MKKNTILSIIVAVIFAGLGLTFSVIYAAKPQPSDELFSSHLPTVPAHADGKDKSLDEYRNKIVVVNFWATWCAPCVKEMPELSALQTELTPKKIRFIGVGIDNPDAIAEFSQKYKISYPLYVAGMTGTELATHLGNTSGGLPFTVILDKSGAIVKTYRGKLDIAKLRADILAVK